MAAFTIAAVATLALATSSAWASCAQVSSIHDNADRADVVLYGQVTGTEGAPGQPRRFVFMRVERVMKGAAFERIGVALGPDGSGGGGPAATSVDYQADVGTDHVLYLKQTAPAGFSTDACSGSHPGAPSGEEQALLGAGRAPDRTPGGLADVQQGDRTIAALATVAVLAAAVGATVFAFRRPPGTATWATSAWWVSLAAGLGCGVVIALVTAGVERSRIAFGPYALFGNGALAVPSILVPLALFIGWIALLRRSDRAPRLPMTVYALGLALGSAVWGILDQGLPGIIGGVFTGALFVIPTALLAAATIAVFRATRIPTNVLTVSAALVLGTLIVLIPPLSSFGGLGIGGIAAGAATTAASRRGGILPGAAATAASRGTSISATAPLTATSRGGDNPVTVALGFALFALMLAQVFALPILGQLFRVGGV
ncbi:MAG: hypothetical protein ABR525_09275 [Candidatus Limnocylindria bacterium]